MVSELSIYQVRHLANEDRISEVIDTFECADGNEALRRGRAWALMDGCGVEVWCGTRLVGRLEPPAFGQSPPQKPDKPILLEGVGTLLDGQVSLGSIDYAVSFFPSPIGPRTLANGELKGDPARISRFIEGALYNLIFNDGTPMSFVVVGIDVDAGAVRIRAIGTVSPPGKRKKSDRRIPGLS